jgi:hypothetical protein
VSEAEASGAEPRRDSSPGERDGESLAERVAEQVQGWAPVVILIAAAVAGFVMGPALAILVLAAGIMIAAIASLWGSLRALFGETRLSGEDAFAMGAPSAEEEQKRAVLRAIKDLEFERGVGKISEDDYRVLMGRYRSEAKRLLRVLDDRAEPRRRRVEQLVRDHLREQGLGEVELGDDAEAPSDEPANEEPPTASTEAEDTTAESEAATDEDTRSGPECGAENDGDAVFCKKCATPLEQADDHALDDEDEDDEDDEDVADDGGDDDDDRGDAQEPGS